MSKWSSIFQYYLLQTLPTGTGPGSVGAADGETPQERMSKLYQEELSRLMQSQQRARLQGGGGADKPPVAPELPGLPGLFPGLGMFTLFKNLFQNQIYIYIFNIM